MRFSDLDGLTVGVWGAGVEIRSFARILAEKLPSARIAVAVEDSDLAAAADLAETVVDASGAPAALRACDVVVRSPGVSIYRPELQAILTEGTPVTTATGLWLAERGGRDVVGITGTKGKSTIASLVAHLLAAAGLPVELAGNIGRPALELLDYDGIAVIELSSYQIADLACGPETALVANLYREHLDWHRTEERYRQDKLRLLTLPGVVRCVLNGTDPGVTAAPRTCSEAALYGIAPGWHVAEGGIAYGDRPVIAAEDLPLLGPHNALNICAALTVLDALGVEQPSLPGGFDGFARLRHRLEIVHETDGVTWIDDSISTTPESALAAIASFPGRPIVLIGGGQDRGQDYGALAKTLAERSAVVLGLPDTGSRLVEAALAAGVPPESALLVPDLPAAVSAATAAASPGTVVLLSPAAPSYNAYRNFQERGNHFRELARTD